MLFPDDQLQLKKRQVTFLYLFKELFYSKKEYIKIR